MVETQLFDFDELEDDDPLELYADAELLIAADDGGVPRGGCLRCGRCRCWMPGPGSRSCCHGCECPSAEHQDLRTWIARVRAGLDMTLEQVLLAGLPVACTAWDLLEVQLLVGSKGSFHPQRDCPDGRGYLAQGVQQGARGGEHQDPRRQVRREGCEEEVLVSVICPTTWSRRRFHGVLYECFKHQTYQPRELVVVDTGEAPSKTLREAAEKDSSVVYYYFKEPLSGISLGVKRNIACYLARGKAIVQFDDDDLYAPGYLELMLSGLERASKQPQLQWEKYEATEENVKPVEGMDLPLASTLRSWHTFDPIERTFTFVDVKKDEQIAKAEKDDWIYGWGFSFAFTRAAWLRCPFSNITFAEDTAFMKAVRQLPAVVTTLSGEDGLCSHTYHPKVSTSNGENQGGQRCGTEVRPPDPLLDLLPKLLAAEGELDEPGGGTRYFAVGSWTNDKVFEELKRKPGGKTYRLVVPVLDPPKTMRFQLCAEGDLSRSFYPDPRKPSKILGPWRNFGVKWSVEVPRSAYSLSIAWDPRGERSLTWTTSSSLPVQFHLVGSWSGWQKFEQMQWTGPGVFSLKVAFQGERCAFQVAQDADWQRRYWPRAPTGFSKTEPVGVCGPGDPPPFEQLNWNVRRPDGCEESLLLVRWEPAGPRVTWGFWPPPVVGAVQRPKTFVVLRGVEARPQLNGEVGVTEEWSHDRWAVRLASGDLPRVRPEHLRLFLEVALAQGSVVRLRGLKDRSLNGLIATCSAWIPDRDAWSLQLWGGQSLGGSLEAKAENLELVGEEQVDARCGRTHRLVG